MEAMPEIEGVAADPPPAPRRRKPLAMKRGRPVAAAAKPVDPEWVAGVVAGLVENMRAVFLARGLPQIAVDRAIGGKSCSRWRDLLRGKSQHPRIDTMIAAAAALGVNLRDMLPGDPPPAPTASAELVAAARAMLAAAETRPAALREVMLPGAADRLRQALAAVDAGQRPSKAGGGDV